MNAIRSKIKYFISLCVLITSACSTRDASDSYRVVLRTDEDGNVLLGSKKALIQEIRSGADLKVGWGAKREKRSIEHLSIPIWISIQSEEEVSVLLDPHYVTTSDTSKINQEWRVTMSTTGDFEAVWYDKYAGEMVRSVPQRHPMVWYVRGGSKYKKPLYLEE